MSVAPALSRCAVHTVEGRAVFACCRLLPTMTARTSPPRRQRLAARTPVADHGRVRVHRQKTEPVWNSWAALTIVVALAAIEWWWRRRRGFA